VPLCVVLVVDMNVASGAWTTTTLEKSTLTSLWELSMPKKECESTDLEMPLLQEWLWNHQHASFKNNMWIRPCEYSHPPDHRQLHMQAYELRPCIF
jgi:hypothetical protein